MLQMLTGYADLAFQFGLADENQADYISSETQAAAKLINDGKFFEAFQVCHMALFYTRLYFFFHRSLISC